MFRVVWMVVIEKGGVENGGGVVPRLAPGPYSDFRLGLMKDFMKAFTQRNQWIEVAVRGTYSRREEGLDLLQ